MSESLIPAETLERVGEETVFSVFSGTATSVDCETGIVESEIAEAHLRRETGEDFGRDPAEIGTQTMLASPPRSERDKEFCTDLDAVAERAAVINTLGFDWASVNATAIFRAGSRSVEARSTGSMRSSPASGPRPAEQTG
ncbi:hypothetical protein [Candidatus Poriferisodalis sp.]|uniref:hypothetical protein n=1 Tax=Candidatus Poriferisodalis sp. TaxID=3101277 RepID=UPI003B012EC1